MAEVEALADEAETGLEEEAEGAAPVGLDGEAVEAGEALAEEGEGVDMARSGGSGRQQQHVASGEKRKSDSKSKSA